MIQNLLTLKGNDIFTVVIYQYYQLLGAMIKRLGHATGTV